jgi:hypothetical protein
VERDSHLDNEYEKNDGKTVCDSMEDFAIHYPSVITIITVIYTEREA